MEIGIKFVFSAKILKPVHMSMHTFTYENHTQGENICACFDVCSERIFYRSGSAKQLNLTHDLFSVLWILESIFKVC